MDLLSRNLQFALLSTQVCRESPMHHPTSNVELSEPVQQWVALGAEQPVLTDAELLELYRYSRSTKNLAEIVRRHSPLVASVIRRLISDSQDAEDAFQATFLVLMVSANKIRNPDSLGAWLYGVAYRTAKRVRIQRRKDKINMTHTSTFEVDLNSTYATDEEPLAIIARELQLEAMDEELSKLPKHLRDALVEHYMVGISVPEIARCLNLSVTAVEGRIKRGRKALRMMLAMRGISLSVVATACIRFQQDFVVASAEPWTNRFIESIGNTGIVNPSLTQLQETNTFNSQLFKLVQGEVVVKTFSRSVLGVASGIFVLCTVGAVGFLSAFANQQGKTLPVSSTTFPMMPANETAQGSDAFVLAQGGGSASSGGGGIAGGFGFGLGGDMIGGGFGSGSSKQPPQKEIVLKFEKPTNSPPAWLDSKVESNEFEEKIRQSLNEQGEVNFNATPLSGVMKYFRGLLEIPIILDEKGLEGVGVTPDEAITLDLPPTKLRDSLSLILRPLGLTYVIDKGCMIVTSTNGNWGAIRYYDVSYILPDNGLTNDIISTIETMISPGLWQTGGGSFTIRCVGSMLVVKADEETNYEIERMLRAISKQTPANLRPKAFVEKPASKPTESEKSDARR